MLVLNLLQSLRWLYSQYLLSYSHDSFSRHDLEYRPSRFRGVSHIDVQIFVIDLLMAVSFLQILGNKHWNLYSFASRVFKNASTPPSVTGYDACVCSIVPA